MAEKNEITPTPTSGSIRPDEAKRKVAQKKRTRRSDKKTNQPLTENLPLHENVDPQVLADLAIKIIHLKRGNGPSAEGQPVRFDSAGLHDSLDDARRLLLAAKGVIEEDIHAYRLFSEDDGLMSYEQIAKRFELRQWKLMTSRNKVEEIILELVERAEKEVQRKMEKYDKLMYVRMGYAGGVYRLADRMRNRIRAMIRDTELDMIFPDPNQVADKMGQFLLNLMGKEIPEDWEHGSLEEFANIAGLNSFIEYACGGMTYEQFIPTGSHLWMDQERLDCLEFFLESVDAGSTNDYKDKAKELNILMRLVRGQSKAAAPMAGHLEDCLRELQKPLPTPKCVKKMAKSALTELTKFRRSKHLTQVVEFQELSSLIVSLESLLGCQAPPEQFPTGKIKDLLKLIRQTEKSLKEPDIDPTELRSNLNKVCKELTETSALLKATVEQAFTFTEEMDKVTEGLERGLRFERITPTDLGPELKNLISALKPQKGVRKCRPYELFLFAAQKNLCREHLVRKRSSLVPGVVTGPSYSSSLSILTSHRGAEITMEIQNPG